jgi:hypothetical protein
MAAGAVGFWRGGQAVPVTLLDTGSVGRAVRGELANRAAAGDITPSKRLLQKRSVLLASRGTRCACPSLLFCSWETSGR